ncbi:MAG: hypothetical protein A2808_00145 [Candidatus Moranbacteria bacterium RIFCSPHIGHO2_01_FULL_55_24]|nr:MAG: hypothetical protein A2808_00145 [Candidatus Moranbacteria bacterium RIFCSPHIGHO2_01_FULL_55_24]
MIEEDTRAEEEETREGKLQLIGQAVMKPFAEIALRVYPPELILPEDPILDNDRIIGSIADNDFLKRFYSLVELKQMELDEEHFISQQRKRGPDNKILMFEEEVEVLNHMLDFLLHEEFGYFEKRGPNEHLRVCEGWQVACTTWEKQVEDLIPGRAFFQPRKVH